MANIEQLTDFFKADTFATGLCGIKIKQADESRAVCEMKVTEHHKNAGGAVQGGAIFTLADFTYAVSANAGGSMTVSVDCSISFISPAKGMLLTAEALKRQENKTLCFYDVSVTDELGTNIAFAKITGYKTKKSLF